VLWKHSGYKQGDESEMRNEVAKALK
jgi:hypothetical protein